LILCARNLSGSHRNGRDQTAAIGLQHEIL
jgi:hypothetical protein